MIRSGRGIGAAGGQAVEPVDGGGDLGGAAVALHGDGPDQDVAREPVAQAVQDIADHRAAGRGDDADDLGQEGKRLFAFRGEEPFGLKLGLALFQHRHQGADARGADVVDVQLVLRLAGEGRQPPGGDDLHPLLGTDPQFGHLPLPADRGQDRTVVLEIEIEMPRAGDEDAADLAAHPDPPELALDHAFQRARDFGHGEVMGVLARLRVVDQVHGAPCAAGAPTLERPEAKGKAGP